MEKEEAQNPASVRTTNKPTWRSVAKERFWRFERDITDLGLLKLLLDDMARTLEDVKVVEIKNDPFCVEIAAFVRDFSVTLAKQEIGIAMKINTLMAMGDFLLVFRDFDAAHFCYDRIIELDPNWDLGYISKAHAFRDAHDLKNAIEFFKKTIDVNPLNKGSYYDLGFYQRFEGLYRDSLDSFSRFLTFADGTSEKDRKYAKMAAVWIRYLEKKIELFGDKRD